MIRMITIGLGLAFAAGGSLYWIEQGQLDDTAPVMSAGLRTVNGVGMLMYFLRVLYQWAPDASGYLGPDMLTCMYRPQERPKLPHEEYEEELARRAELQRAELTPELHPELHPETIEV